jgi:nanoRNase/pAp phosphatase (c-di-AMP/oligoRNAs hydrolase)
VIRAALKDIGSGGGHDHMAGGALDVSVKIDKDELFKRFSEAYYTSRSSNERYLDTFTV